MEFLVSLRALWLDGGFGYGWTAERFAVVVVVFLFGPRREDAAED